MGLRICLFLQQTLKKYGIDPSKMQIYEIDQVSETQSIQSYMGKVTGGTTVPRVFIGGQFVGGNSEVTQLDSSGKLRELLTAAEAI